MLKTSNISSIITCVQLNTMTNFILKYRSETLEHSSKNENYNRFHKSKEVFVAGHWLLQEGPGWRSSIHTDRVKKANTSKKQINYKFGLQGNKQRSNNSAPLPTGTSHKVPPCSDPPASDPRLRLYAPIQVNSLSFFNLCFLVFLHFPISVRWHSIKKGWEMVKLDWELRSCHLF